MTTRVLAIGAHPGDVAIGAGATLLAHRAAGHEVTVMTISTGAGAPARAAAARAAAERLGARLYLVDGEQSVEQVESVLHEVLPDVVYTHSARDTHADHRAVHRAVLGAARAVPTVACFQSPSITPEFRPNRFVDVSAHIRGKLDLLACFASRRGTRGYLAEDIVLSTARFWSRHAAGRYAEPFEVVRERPDLAAAGRAVSSRFTLAAAA